MGGYIGAKTGTLVASASDIRGDISATDTTPEITLKNTTETDADGSRDGKITFKGEQSGGEESTLAQIQSSHDGTADDQKGDLIFKTNDGSDGSSPTERMRIDSVGTVTITNASNDTQLLLESTDADASSGPVLELFRNSASPADNDLGGAIEFYAENDAGEKIQYQLIQAYMPDVSDGSEDGAFQQYIMKDGTAIQRMEHSSTETVFNQDSADVDFRVESNGNANMLFVDGANDKVGIGTAAPYKPLTVSASIGGTKADILDLQSSTSGGGTQPMVRFGTEAANSNTLGRIGFIDIPNYGGGFVVETNSSGGATHTTTEKFRVNKDGDVLVATTDDGASGAGFVAKNEGNYGHLILKKTYSGNATGVHFYHNGSAVGTINYSNSSTTYNTSSDYRLKENVADVTDGITRIKQLAPKRFNFIADPDTTVDGFLAHEAQAVVPEAITGTKDEVDDDDNAVMQGIDQSKLVPLLTAALQEAIAKIETLETKVAALEG